MLAKLPGACQGGEIAVGWMKLLRGTHPEEERRNPLAPGRRRCLNQSVGCVRRKGWQNQRIREGIWGNRAQHRNHLI